MYVSKTRPYGSAARRGTNNLIVISERNSTSGYQLHQRRSTNVNGDWPRLCATVTSHNSIYGRFMESDLKEDYQVIDRSCSTHLHDGENQPVLHQLHFPGLHGMPKRGSTLRHTFTATCMWPARRLGRWNQLRGSADRLETWIHKAHPRQMCDPPPDRSGTSTLKS